MFSLGVRMPTRKSNKQSRKQISRIFFAMLSHVPIRFLRIDFLASLKLNFECLTKMYDPQLIFLFIPNNRIQRGAAYSYTRIVGTRDKTYVSLRKNLRF